MNNSQVAHLWANKSRKSGNGSHFFFDGDTIYSYGRHFPIARHYEGAVLFTTDSYSSSTACHKGLVAGAVTHLPVFEVENPTRKPSRRDVSNYGKLIKRSLAVAEKRRDPSWEIDCLKSLVKEANKFCVRFGFAARFKMPDTTALKKRAKLAKAKKAKATAERQLKLEQESAELVQRWIAGESVSIPYNLSTVYLRVRVSTLGEVAPEMETSKGATVPLSEAQKAFRFASAMRERGWHRNGETFKVGEFQLDAVNEQGVVAGCHRIGWPEIERFAKSQAWI